VRSGKCCLSPKDEFIYRHGMKQIYSDFILSHVSFAPFLASSNYVRMAVDIKYGIPSAN
jgi:hypothetical protein